MADRETAADFDQNLLNLYDDYVHGRVERRDFMVRAAKFAVGGLTVEALLSRLSPNYSFAQQVANDDPRIVANAIEYDSPKGAGKMKGLLARPKDGSKFPAVLVVHENRGLNPYIEDVVRRLATSGFVALGPDALTPFGGYPGNDDEGRALQAKRDSEEMLQDFMAAAEFLKAHEYSSGKVGVVGFCYGGGVSNQLAVRLPETILAAAPYYGAQPAKEDVPKIKASLTLHYAALDNRINAGWPEYEKALQQNNVRFEAFVYEGVNHGFHNDTTPRFDKTAAELSWKRTLDLFNRTLRN